MSKKTCKYGKLKHPKGSRRCKRTRRSSSGGRRVRRAAKTGAGLLVLGLIGAGTIYYVVQNAKVLAPPA